jgi:nucleotide-binding universal stress UspA family protein
MTSRPTTDPIPGETAQAAPGDVVVALGAGDATPSLRYAVAEARSRRAGLHLVHVLRMHPVDDPDPVEEIQRAIASAHAVLDAGVATARHLDLGVRVTTHLAQHGTVARAIAEHSRDASLVVIQHRHLARLHRVVAHSVTNAVAAHTEAPVAAVPEDWSPASASPGYVVVGVRDLHEARTLVAFAAEEAVRRRSHLWILNAGVPLSRDAAGIAAVADGVRTSHPQVRVTTQVEQGEPEALLTGAVTAAEVLVLGRRHFLRPGTHLGSVARDVLDRARCPVILVTTP